MRVVPCNGCRRCCVGDSFRPVDADEGHRYATVQHPANPSQLVLATGDDGNCVYLGLRGCLTHDDKPRFCQAFDCRDLAVFSYSVARKGGFEIVWRKGRELKKVSESA